MPPGIDALPAWALRLDPVAAWPARVARRQALGHDALETKLVAMVEQQRAIGKGLHLTHERHPRFAAQPMQVTLALSQR